MINTSFVSKRTRKNNGGDLFGYSLYYIINRNVRCMAGKFYTVLSDDDVNDLVQDTYIKVLNKKANCNLDKNFEGWVFRICQNAVRDRAKTISKRREWMFSFDENFDNEEESATDLDHSPIFIDYTFATDKPIMREEFEENVRNCIERLSPESRRAVELTIEETPYDEMARELECSENTARVRVCRARKQLQAMGIGA